MTAVPRSAARGDEQPRPPTSDRRRHGRRTGVARGYEGEPTIVVLDDPRALAQDAAGRIAVAVERAVRERGEAHISLTGGSSAVALYQALGASPWRDAIDWNRVHLWWGDERFVPLDHPESCANLASTVLLRSDARSGQSGDGASGADVEAEVEPGVYVPIDQVHPFPMGDAIDHGHDTAWVAQQYAAEVRSLLPVDADGTPVFDVGAAGPGAGRPHPVGVPRQPGARARRPWPCRSRHRPTSSRTWRGSPSTRRSCRRRDSCW